MCSTVSSPHLSLLFPCSTFSPRSVETRDLAGPGPLNSPQRRLGCNPDGLSLQSRQYGNHTRTSGITHPPPPPSQNPLTQDGPGARIRTVVVQRECGGYPFFRETHTGELHSTYLTPLYRTSGS